MPQMRNPPLFPKRSTLVLPNATINRVADQDHLLVSFHCLLLLLHIFHLQKWIEESIKVKCCFFCVCHLCFGFILFDCWGFGCYHAISLYSIFSSSFFFFQCFLTLILFYIFSSPDAAQIDGSHPGGLVG